VIEPFVLAVAALWTFDLFVRALDRERRRNVAHNRRLAARRARLRADTFDGLARAMALFGASTLEASEALAGLARVLPGDKVRP